MSITIVLPDGSAPKTAQGTRILTEDGVEIKDVSRCIIDIEAGEVVTAHLSVAVRDIQNLELIAAHTHIDGVYPDHEPEHAQILDRLKQLKSGD